MTMRAILGAITADANTRSAILNATRELLTEVVRVNHIAISDIVSAFFTMSPDLDAAFPAEAARDLGWTSTALLDAQAPRVENNVPRCISVLIYCETQYAANEIRNVYLRDAVQIRRE